MPGAPIDSQILEDLVSTRMPFGKYKDYLICDLPEPYVAWFYKKGFPEGRIGVLLFSLYEIQINGLQYLLKPLKEKDHGQ